MSTYNIYFPDRTCDSAYWHAITLTNQAHVIRRGQCDCPEVKAGLADIADEMEVLAARLKALNTQEIAFMEAAEAAGALDAARAA
jgi:hypothetical protein